MLSLFFYSSAFYFLLGHISGKFAYPIAGFFIRPGHLFLALVLPLSIIHFKMIREDFQKFRIKSPIATISLILFTLSVILSFFINPMLRSFCFLFWFLATLLAFWGTNHKSNPINFSLGFIILQTFNSLICFTQILIYLWNQTVFTNHNFFLGMIRTSGMVNEPSYLAYSSPLVIPIALLLFERKSLKLTTLIFVWACAILTVCLTYSRLTQLVFALTSILVMARIVFFKKRFFEKYYLGTSFTTLTLIGLLISIQLVPSYYLGKNGEVAEGIELGSQTMRKVAMERGIYYILDMSFIPTGIGVSHQMLKTHFTNPLESPVQSIHNTYLEIAVEIGVWALGFYLILLVSIANYLKKDWFLFSLFMIIIIVNLSFINNVMFPEFWLFLVILFKERKLQHEKSTLVGEVL